MPGRTALAAGVALGVGILFGVALGRRDGREVGTARAVVGSAAAEDGAQPATYRADGAAATALLGTMREVMRQERESLRADLSREIAGIREEVRALRAEREPDRAETAVEPATAARGREAFDRALAMVRERVQAGEWRAEDREQLHQLLPLLEQAQLRDVLTTMLPAINEGRMTVASEIMGPPF